MADTHYSTVTQLQRILFDEVQHLSSGSHQLEKQEQTAYCSLLAGQQCIELHSRVYSELLKQLLNLAKLLADFKDVKSVPQLIVQLPSETFRK
jgi:hypothetical protein